MFGCPEPRGNHDPLMHAYMVDTQCAAIFKKQREKSLNEVLLACDPVTIDNASADAIEEGLKQSAILLHDDLYRLMLDVKAPGSVLNVTKLRSELTKGGRYTPKEIEAMFVKCTSLRTPAKSFSVAHE